VCSCPISTTFSFGLEPDVAAGLETFVAGLEISACRESDDESSAGEAIGGDWDTLKP